MKALVNKFGLFARDERGATAIEYGLILALMALAIISALTSVGTSTSEAFDRAGEGWN